MRHWVKTIKEVYEALNAAGMKGSLVDDLNKVYHEMLDAQDHLLPAWRKMKKPIMCIDFDGCISQYKLGWNGVANIDDELPVDGAINWIENAIEHFTVLIFSSRCNDKSGIEAMEKWLCKYGLSKQALSSIIFQPGKPSAYVLIDDRAIKFEGNWFEMPAPQMIKDHFAPWYYRESGWHRSLQDSHTCVHDMPYDDCPDCRH